MTFNLRNALFSIGWLALIYWLSSRPDLSTVEDAPVLQVLSNLAHAPLFAVLAFCWLKTIGAEPPSRGAYLLVAVITALYGVLDEWHQSFVPGRYGDVMDVLMDVAGAWGLLLAVRLRSLRRAPSAPDSRAARTWAN